jgi:CRISPR-associated protein Cas1
MLAVLPSFDKMTVKGQMNHYNIKVLRGYGVSIALKNNKVSLRNGIDVFAGEAEKVS